MVLKKNQVNIQINVLTKFTGNPIPTTINPKKERENKIKEREKHKEYLADTFPSFFKPNLDLGTSIYIPYASYSCLVCSFFVYARHRAESQHTAVL